MEMLNKLSASELDSILTRGKALLEQKKKEEAAQALLQKERERQEKIEQENKRLQEIAMLQEKLRKLQSQPAYTPEDVKGDNFVMREPASQKPDASVQPQAKPAGTVFCPYCNHSNPSGSLFCLNCGQKITSPAAQEPAPQKGAPSERTPYTKIVCPSCRHLNVAESVFCQHCGHPLPAKAAPSPASAPSAAPAPAPAPNPAPATVPSVQYHDGTLKKWEKLPGEKVEMNNHQIKFIEPDMSKKYVFSMEITNKRILITRVGAAAASAGAAFGLVGALARELSNAGPKPWLEIPFNAVKDYGVTNKKEFYFIADQKYVLKNKHYDDLFDKLTD